jgi:hypothetical protein
MDTAKKAAGMAASGEKELESKLTLLWHEIPLWLQDNHYIIRGYRPATNSYIKSFQSLGYLHNETVNIYTHLIGAALAFIGSGIIYSTLSSRYASATKEDVLVFGCYFLGAIACLGMSATYHTISNHSHAVAIWGNKLDYLGIVFLIWGSFIPVLYYAFQSEPTLMRTYAIMVCFSAHAYARSCGITVPDLHPRSRHIHRICPPPLPYPSAPPIPRADVCRYGSFSRLSRHPLHQAVWSKSHAHEHWFRLDCAARRFVYCWGGLVCF